MKGPDSISVAEARRVFEYVKRRAQTDAAFRQKLLDAPRETLEEEFDIALPERFNIRFVENLGADLTVVLPDLSESSDELSDDDLDHVAGGAGSGSPPALDEVDQQREVLERAAWISKITS